MQKPSLQSKEILSQIILRKDWSNLDNLLSFRQPFELPEKNLIIFKNFLTYLLCIDLKEYKTNLEDYTVIFNSNHQAILSKFLEDDLKNKFIIISDHTSFHILNERMNDSTVLEINTPISSYENLKASITSNTPKYITSKNNLIYDLHNDNIILNLYSCLGLGILRNHNSNYLSIPSLSLLNLFSYFRNIPEDIKKAIVHDLPHEVFTDMVPSIQATMTIQNFSKSLEIIKISQNQINLNIQESLNNQINTLSAKLSQILSFLELYSNPKTYQSIPHNKDKIIHAIKNKEILNIHYTEIPKIIRITFGALPYLFYDSFYLQKLISNFKEPYKKYLQKVIDGEYEIYTLPITLKFIFTKTALIEQVNIQALDFEVENIHTDLKYVNLHLAFNAPKGCRGTFTVPFIKLGQKLDLEGMIILAQQYIQTLNLHDQAGDYTLKRAYIVDTSKRVVFDMSNGKEYLNNSGPLINTL